MGRGRGKGREEALRLADVGALVVTVEVARDLLRVSRSEGPSTRDEGAVTVVGLGQDLLQAAWLDSEEERSSVGAVLGEVAFLEIASRGMFSGKAQEKRHLIENSTYSKRSSRGSGGKVSGADGGGHGQDDGSNGKLHLDIWMDY